MVEALSGTGHDVVGVARSSGEIKVNLDEHSTIRAMFDKISDVDAVISCAGNAAFKPFAELTDADYELGLRNKLMGQVSLARIAKDRLRDGGSITLTTGVLAMIQCREAHPSRWSTGDLKDLCGLPRWSYPEICAVSPPWVKESSAWTHLLGLHRPLWQKPMSRL